MEKKPKQLYHSIVAWKKDTFKPSVVLYSWLEGCGDPILPPLTIVLMQKLIERGWVIETPSAEIEPDEAGYNELYPILKNIIEGNIQN